MKDTSAKKWAEKKVMYKVGSCFKGCNHCGEYKDLGRGRKRYSTGLQVFRAYRPKETGWTYKCWDCCAVDHDAWANAHDVGEEPILGTREVVYRKKAEMRRDRVQASEAAPSRAETIKRLEDQVARLVAVINEGAN